MQKFTIQNRHGLKIVGNISIPENPKGLAFVMHGLGGTKEQPHILLIADIFLKNEHTVVNFDGTNSLGESEGKYENATMQFHYEDLVDVINWAKTQEWYMEPFVLAGHSLGGYAVARYAEDYPNEVKGVFPFALVVAGQFSYEANEKFYPERLKEWKETGWKEEESKSFPGVIKRLPWSHMEERLKHDLRPNAKNITMPILFVTGDEDTSCTPESQRILYDLVESSNKEFHIVKGAPHTFREPEHLEQLKNILDNWLKKLN